MAVGVRGSLCGVFSGYSPLQVTRPIHPAWMATCSTEAVALAGRQALKPAAASAASGFSLIPMAVLGGCRSWLAPLHGTWWPGLGYLGLW